MFCTKCGNKINDDNQAFCTSCGAPIPGKSVRPNVQLDTAYSQYNMQPQQAQQAQQMQQPQQPQQAQQMQQPQQFQQAPSYQQPQMRPPYGQPMPPMGQKKNNTALIILIIVGGVLLLTAMILGGIFLFKGIKKNHTQVTPAVTDDGSGIIDIDEPFDGGVDPTPATGNDVEETADMWELMDEFVRNENVATICDIDQFWSVESGLEEFGMFYEGAAVDYESLYEAVGIYRDEYAFSNNRERVSAEYWVMSNNVGVIRFGNLDTYSEGDDSYCAFFFAEKDGELSMTYFVSSAPRYETIIFDDGRLFGMGSGGAGDSYYWLYYIDEEGNYSRIYDLNVTYEFWCVPYEMDMDFSFEDVSSLQFSVLTTDEGEYVSYLCGEAYQERYAKMIRDYYVDMGCTYVENYDEIDWIIQDAVDAVGLPNGEGEEIENWIHIDGSGYFTLYGEEVAEEAAIDYILPDSDSRYLEEYELYGLTVEELRFARNEIYARHGRLFKDEELQNYFDSKDWYYGYIEPEDFSENMLSDIEKANRDLISNYEKKVG